LHSQDGFHSADAVRSDPKVSTLFIVPLVDVVRALFPPSGKRP
jgi:hypothetical protein